MTPLGTEHGLRQRSGMSLESEQRLLAGGQEKHQHAGSLLQLHEIHQALGSKSDWVCALRGSPCSATMPAAPSFSTT